MYKCLPVCFLVLLCNLQSSSCRAGEAVRLSVQANGRDDSCTSHALLNGWERAQFLEVSTGPQAEVLAQFLSDKDCDQIMLEGLRSLGAIVQYANERSGYALVSLSKDKLLDTLDLPGIAYAYTRDDDRIYDHDSDAKIPPNGRKTEPVADIMIPYPRVATMLPKDGPYFEADKIGLTGLWKQYPHADGRGVRVAVPDEGFDLLHPALQQARDAAGSIVPKIADLGTLTSPENDSGWIRFGDPVKVIRGSFDAAGRTWTVPEDGMYRFGIFKHDLILGPAENSHVKKLSLSVGVLWDQQSGHVWVDTDSDGSFKNQRALGDYGTTYDIDWFGAKQSDDDNRIPFGVKIDAARDAVYLQIGDEHGAYIGGALAGNRLTGGLFNGAAPSAQLIDYNIDRATLIPSIVAMSSRTDVDVVNRSGGVGRVYTGPQDGIEDFAQHVLERLIAVYNKPIVAYSAAVGTIHVEDYAGPKMLRVNRQLAPPYLDTINSFVWNLSNGLVNTVLAPSANLDTDSRYKPGDITWPDGRRHTFQDDYFNVPAPDGYTIGNNPSPTIPVVSGVLADLISEAKRDHVRYNAARLNNAIFTGTRLLEGFPLSQQGYGLINAVQSWGQLVKMAKADDPANPELTSFTLSRMEGGHTEEVQGFHADLANVGEKLDGEIWITRRGGYAGGRKYTFSLRGNDGTYTLLDHQATLVRNQPVRVRFRTNGQSGWEIAFLELRDVTANVVMQDVPLSVRVPALPEAMAPGVDKYQSTIQPLHREYRYVRVGDEVQAARYVMHIPYTGPNSISTRVAPGARYSDRTAPPGEPVDAVHHVGPMETVESLTVNSEPGTQAILWENRGRPEYATKYDGPAPDVPIHGELTVTKYAVAVTKTQQQVLSVTNQLAEVDGRVELFDAKFSVSELHGPGNHAMAETAFEMPENLAQWRVKVTGMIGGTPTDAYLFNCTAKTRCYIVSQQEITDKGALLVIDKPQAGSWKIVVRSREQVTVQPTYRLSEAQLTPTQPGTTNADTKHSNGEKWTVSLPDTTRYAAFRIAGTPGVEREKNGLLIAMTPLEADAP